MKAEQYLQQYQTFLFEFDNVLYPEKDYILQVYYLFSQFIEYAEQIEAAGILDFMKADFDAHGHEGILDRTLQHFQLDSKYKVNFNLLMQNVRLPLKLLLFDEMLHFLKMIIEKGKQIFLIINGDPLMALNKFRQTEWQGLETKIKVYFSSESPENSTISTAEKIINLENLKLKDSVIVTNSLISKESLSIDNICFSLDKLFLP